MPAIGYTTNPATTATDWTAEPTCAVYATTDTTFATPLSGAQGAGTYVTHCTGGTSNAYNPTAYVDGTLVIEKPPVVVSAATPVPTLSEWGLLLLSLLLGLTTLWRTRKCPG